MRPFPPESVLDAGDIFIAAPEIIAWARETFVDDGASLQNEDHRHLQHASLGALWTNVTNARQGRSVVGQCEHGLPPLSSWQRARFEQQLVGWFGEVPDFVLTFDARYAADCSDDEFCALVEHELYHAGQERDQFGAPKFRKSGKPAFGIRAHDIEEFLGVVRRYGADAAHVQAMVEAAKKGPEIARVRIAQACGTCLLRGVA
ncbi:hypothetical protein EN781_00220 [Mesorhizobium sp. M4A.F.Ca.ET.090.04.2.1]|uniref:putative metallopeptidase n=1 Tax=Mesorhizobium sp. M4A.F.Ca.ET.090.04.2.1 TaxID=2496663 RepID=UPI000FCC6DA8|nr:putative metallopeptidase [Mesorhizobium sp. M4A.F.Ca.ET.090.04.2.1]RVC47596.1 hypothetical protein EN781_00220 [Mesorhizobium sp. M4A.F.Ca.ET.090.04.2.1]